MKQKLLFLIVMLAFLLPARLSAFEYTYEGVTLSYEVIDEEAKTCEVSGYKDFSGALDIPDVAKDGTTDYSVISIGETAFYNNTGLTSVEIPNSVTSIGSKAYKNCIRLESINIPNSVTSIGEGAFEGCTSLLSVVLPNSISSIDDSTFDYCTSLESVVIPNSVTSIGNRAFCDCNSLKSIEFPSGVTSIGEMAFHYCKSIKVVIIPESVNRIGLQAFRQCHNLELFIIQSSNVTFEGETFHETQGPRYLFAAETLDCSALGNDINIIRFDESSNLSLMEDGTILADNGRTLFFAPVYAGTQSYAIPEGITKIKGDAFRPIYGNRGEEDTRTLYFSSITIPSTIELIEPNAFVRTEIERVNITDWSKWYSNAKLCNFYSNPYWNSKPYTNSEFSDKKYLNIESLGPWLGWTAPLRSLRLGLGGV